MVEEAEEAVRHMMYAAGTRAWTFSDADWEEAFGISKRELEERERHLKAKYRKTPRRRRAERAAIRRLYAETHAMLGVPLGLETTWR